VNTEVNLSSNNFATDSIQNADMAKYVTGTNLDLTFLKGLNLGGTWLQIFDHKKSYKGDDTVFQETAAQKTAILSLRPGIDIGKTFGLPSLLELDISAEVAFSIDDTVAFDSEKKEFIYRII
jgi:hypothetical protein